jgi:hypothetical protein
MESASRDLAEAEPAGCSYGRWNGGPDLMFRIVLGSTDWATIASFATAFGTLVLAIATFASIRSANRSARVAEAAFYVQLRPVLSTSRLQDPVQKIRWMDDHWFMLEGNRGAAEVVDENIYLAISLRNAGSGMAVAVGWAVNPDVALADVPHFDADRFRRQTRDLYIAPGDIGFWQGAIRDSADPDYVALRKRVEEAEQFTIELLYGDLEGGQRTITRFGMVPHRTDGAVHWFPNVALHWNLDRPDPR